MQRIVEYTISFVILILSQIFIFDNINIMGYVNPYVYIMFIIILPMEIKSAILLLTGFGTGALMDILTGNSGLCAMALTFIAFIRPSLIILISGREVVNNGGMPSAATMGVAKFWTYITSMTLAYNIPFFFLENMSTIDVGHTVLRIVFSTIFTVLVIYLSHLMLNRKTSAWQ